MKGPVTLDDIESKQLAPDNKPPPGCWRERDRGRVGTKSGFKDS